MLEQQGQQRVAFFWLSSLMRVVKPSLTNSAFLAGFGWVRITGWLTGGWSRRVCSQRARSSGRVP